MRTVAVLLAAGLGTRFDPLRPGAKLESCIGGVTVGQRALTSLMPAVDAVIVAVRSADSDLSRFASAHGCHVVRPSDAFDVAKLGEGMGYSLAAAARHATSHFSAADVLIVALADMPWLRTESARSIVDLAQLQVRASAYKNEHCIVRPRYRNTPGHPIAFSRSLWNELSQCSGDVGAKAVIDRHRACVRWFDTDDAGVVRDVDIVEDLAPPTGECVAGETRLRRIMTLK